MGIEKIGEVAREFGLGTKFDLPLSSITKGLIPTKAWKKKKNSHIQVDLLDLRLHARR